MRSKLKFIYSVLKHKYYVFLAGIFLTKANIFDLIVHDYSKFSFTEFKPYVDRFYNNKKDNYNDFAEAWLHHQNVNKHHWEYWISRTTHNLQNNLELKRETLLEMPDRYVREMVADWLAANRTYNNEKKWVDIEHWDWMINRGSSLMRGRLHPITIDKIDNVFSEIYKKQNGIRKINIFKSYLNNVL